MTTSEWSCLTSFTLVRNGRERKIQNENIAGFEPTPPYDRKVSALDHSAIYILLYIKLVYYPNF